MWEWEGSRCCGRPALASDCLTTPCWDAGAARPGNEFRLPGTPARRSSRPRAPSSAAFVFGGGLVWSGGGGLRVAGSRRWWSLKHKGEERGRSHRDMIFFVCLFLRFAWRQLQRNSEKWAEGRNVDLQIHPKVVCTIPQGLTWCNIDSSWTLTNQQNPCFYFVKMQCLHRITNVKWKKCWKMCPLWCHRRHWKA